MTAAHLNPTIGRGLGIAFAVSLALASSPTRACSCVATMATGSGTIAGLMGTGSAAVVAAMTTGFQQVGAQVMASSAQNEKRIIDALDFMAKRLGNEVRQLPVHQAEIDQHLNERSPSRRATEECRYGDRARDHAVTETLVAAQQRSLTNATVQYNEMTSLYPEGVDPGARFMAQTNRALRTAPDIKVAPMALVNKPNKFGALTPEETQNASTALNLSMNPSPPARAPNPTTPRALADNTRADLQNLRMSIPQSVSQQILSYETPLLNAEPDSWAAQTLARVDPNLSLDEDFMLSKSDLIKLMATHRTKDAVWLGNVAAKEKQGVLKDIALAKADSLAMDYELWVQDRNMALMMSQLLAAKIRQEDNQ